MDNYQLETRVSIQVYRSRIDNTWEWQLSVGDLIYDGAYGYSTAKEAEAEATEAAYAAHA